MIGDERRTIAQRLCPAGVLHQPGEVDAVADADREVERGAEASDRQYLSLTEPAPTRDDSLPRKMCHVAGGTSLARGTRGAALLSGDKTQKELLMNMRGVTLWIPLSSRL